MKPELNWLCSDIIRHILKYLDVRSKKNVRLVCSNLKEVVDQCGGLFQYWRFTTQFTSTRLCKYLDEVETVLGLELNDTSDAGIKYLGAKHPEIQEFQLGNGDDGRGDSKITTVGFIALLSLPNLTSMIFNKNFKFVPTKFHDLHPQNLKTLILRWCDIDEPFLLQIIKNCKESLQSLNVAGNRNISAKFLKELCRSCLYNLTYLDISLTNVSGTNLSGNSGSLPRLQTLNLGACRLLTDEGLLEILNIFGGTLQSLDICWNEITGNNLSEIQGTLPCMENVNLNLCKKFTDHGLLQIVRLCGKTLKSLNINSTLISGKNLSDHNGTLPCIETLVCQGCKELTSEGLSNILQACGTLLKSLNISNTNIAGINGNKNYETCSSLENLNMVSCRQVTDEGFLKILQTFGGKLKSLNIVMTSISGKTLSEYEGTLPCIENLNAHFNGYLKDDGLVHLLRLCKGSLKYLDLSSTNITGKTWDSHLLHLDTLDLSSCSQLTDEGLLRILVMLGRNCKSLHISKTNITGEFISNDSEPDLGLETLNCQACKELTDRGLMKILNLCKRTLKSLDISRTNITGSFQMKYHGSLSCLEKLNLEACRELTDKGLIRILSMCGDTLKHIDMSSTNIVGETLSRYKGSQLSLNYLDCGWNSNLTDKGLLKLLWLSGSKLKILHLSNTQITGTKFIEFLETLPSLESLNFWSCDLFTDKGLLQVLQMFGGSLKSLNLSHTKIKGRILSDYTGSLPRLETLNLQGCPKMSDQGLMQILQLCGDSLKSLDIEYCNSISGVGMRRVLREYGHLQLNPFLEEKYSISDEEDGEWINVEASSVSEVDLSRWMIIKESNNSICNERWSFNCLCCYY